MAPPVSVPSAQQAVAVNVRGRRPGGPDRWLYTAIVAVAVLVVIASAALAASLTSTPPAPLLAAGTTPAAAPGTGPLGQSSGGGATASTGNPSGSGSSTTTTTVANAAPSPVGAPVISGLVPATGAPGQGIEVSGTNFLSPDGRIVALFNGQVTATSCPAQNTCTVTVPQLTGSSSAEVTIATADGTSNAVTFTYS